MVDRNGLLVTDPAAQGVLTLTYSSTSGAIQNSVLTQTNQSVVRGICWSAYSPTVDNYYVVGAGSTPGFVELNLNLASTSNPVSIIRYYQISTNVGTLDPTIVTVAGVDYLYVIETVGAVITSYRLDGSGNAVFLEQVAIPEVLPNAPRLEGIAAYVQTHWRSRDYQG